MKISPLFSDHMVIQRHKNVNVYGIGSDGETVTVTLDKDTVSVKVVNGKWCAVLPPREQAKGLEMTVSCGEFSRTFTDIAVGEIWLAGGQSNMEYELRNCTTGRSHLENDKGVDVRYYYTQKIVDTEPGYEEKVTNNCWKLFDSVSAENWSAVGYIFAKELSERLGCTVGIIGCNWGGTKACYWMSDESLIKDTDMRVCYDRYLASTEGKTEEEMTREYREYEAYDREWNVRKEKYYETAVDPTWDECQKVCGVCKYPGPTLPLNPFSPTRLYKSMIKLVCPYTIAGFLYYQGESDDDEPENYYKLLRGLIDLWRTDWGDDSLPFLIVQLPMHMYKGDEDKKNWCIIREAQAKAYRTIRNTGLAVAIDCGEFNEIHPHDKEQVAHRLCLQALYTTYGDRDESFNAPEFLSALRSGSNVTIKIKTSSPLVIRGKDTGLELAGADGVFYPAAYTIDNDTVTACSPDVPEPVYVRYLWTNYTADIPICNRAGLPLAPFIGNL